MLRKSKNRASIHSISEISTKTHHVVLLHFIPRYYCHKMQDSAILFDILSMKSGTITDTVEWNIPKDVQLVDEIFNHGSIDLLIAANLLYEIQCSGRKTRPGNYPILQETTNSSMLMVLEI